MIDPVLGFWCDPKSAGIPGRSEQAVQTGIPQMLALQFPGYMFASIKNEGKQHPGQGRLTNLAGRRAGFVDGIITGPDAWVAFIEVKSRNGDLSDHQKHELRRLHDLGHRVAMVRSAASLAERMREWLC
jgi:hypothetical protein